MYMSVFLFFFFFFFFSLYSYMVWADGPQCRASDGFGDTYFVIGLDVQFDFLAR